MALQASGQISLSDVNTELSLSSTAQIALNDAAVRDLIGKSSGAQFGLAELYGASSVVGWIYNSYNLMDQINTFFADAKVNSNGDVFAVLMKSTRVAGRATNNAGGTTFATDLYQTIELHKLNSSGVLQDRNTYANQGAYNEGLGRFSPLNPARQIGIPHMKLLLQGTSSMYLDLQGIDWQQYIYDYGAYIAQPVITLFKFNQSNLNQEDSRWHHIHMNSRTNSYFGGSPYTLRSGAYGHNIFPEKSHTFLNGSGKFTVLASTFQENNQKQYFLEARYPSNPSYNSVPENLSAVRITTSNSSFSHTQNSTAVGVSFAASSSENWHIICPQEHNYCLFKKTATESTQGYSSYTQSNGGSRINTASITKVNADAHVRDLKRDGNGNPAVFGYGGTKSFNGTIADGVWCQKFNSSGAKTIRFSFCGNNPSSGSGHNGRYSEAIFDSSDNCYMVGTSQITENNDGIWSNRNSQKPYITWIACFNTNGIYQWHKYLDVKEWNAGWSSGMAAYAYTYPVHITGISLNDDEDLILSGTSQYHPGNGYPDKYNAFVMKFPRNGSVSNGFVGHTATMPWGHTANIGIQIGEFGGNGNEQFGQFFACSEGNTQAFQNNLYETTSVNWNFYSSSMRNSSNSYTSSLPQGGAKSHTSSDIKYYGVVYAYNSNEKLSTTTPPTEASGAGTQEF